MVRNEGAGRAPDTCLAAEGCTSVHACAKVKECSHTYEREQRRALNRIMLLTRSVELCARRHQCAIC